MNYQSPDYQVVPTGSDETPQPYGVIATVVVGVVVGVIVTDTTSVDVY